MKKFGNERIKYIGGSDFGTVLDVNPYKKRIELVLEKAEVLANTFEGNYATDRGTRLEDLVIELFENETGLLVKDQQRIFEREKTETCIKLLCHVDGITSNEFVFEAKTTDVKSKTWENGIPDYYKAQLEFNMFLSSLNGSYITVAFCDGDNIVGHKTYTYTRQLSDRHILKVCEEFTKDVEQYKQLGVINSGKIKDFEIDSKMIERYEELEETIKEIKKQLKPFEDEKKLIESQFKQAIGNDYGLQNDLYRITLSNRITSPTIGYKVTRSGIKIEYKE